MIRDICEVTLWQDDSESLQKSLNVLKKQITAAGIFKALQTRKQNPSVAGRRRAKEIKARQVRERNLKRQNQARLLMRGARRR